MWTHPLTIALVAVGSSLLTIFLTPWLQHHFWKYQRRDELRLTAINDFNRLTNDFLARTVFGEPKPGLEDQVPFVVRTGRRDAGHFQPPQLDQGPTLEERNKDLGEALERQMATADILRAISQAQTDVQPVFEVIADSAMRFFGAWGAAVVRYDGEMVSMVAARGGSPGSADAARERLQPPHRPTFAPERTVLTKRAHHVVDVETDPSCSSEFRRHAAAEGVRSLPR
jgi:hypothetical protein